MLKLCLLSLNVNEPSNLFLFQKNPYYPFLTFVNVKTAQKQTLIAFFVTLTICMSPWKYLVLILLLHCISCYYLAYQCMMRWNIIIINPPKSSFYGIITELKNLEWLNRSIGRQNLYFLMPHALLFGKFVQHPRRVISLQNS